MADPTAVIKQKLQMLRADREITESEIQSLDLEKESLQTVRFNCLFVLNVIIFNYLLLFI